jgi:OmpA-OmpF porin, OOP family
LPAFGPVDETQTPSADASVTRASPAIEGSATRITETDRQPASSASTSQRPASRTGSEQGDVSTDALFDFGKADLRPAGRALLDEFASNLDATSPASIRVIGYTDRIGSDAVNQRLSEQRAESVKAYLVSKGVSSSRMQTEGRGASQPVTDSGDCLGETSSAVIACLQPDRRVHLELTGSSVSQR